uniref:Uncharacterized protein n=1 Tax=Helicotheca tamesis TaxID=374047 RepID=A0A7S2MC95_9STRA|mmetsp:Transcript_13275/g.18268  ORF Transcript_13275/g.18268 Transcript_13275/m.18268 type:complete len:133 (+) Transcript_13275:106-504(+)|eukprot:CAMPEP_0185741174 /NCGR_PEP_ID=MMETSP1171-20130828/38817_1 /TAXON_ID=374046 /ORGANISM="Helicotheca tamensis, Strain CCMP826" /LENGTH=132 /DNA_ID=CAMNT_0028413129 /DNA_START=476 /DNA_END=874 /DNA_ORIENTATION=+
MNLCTVSIILAIVSSCNAWMTLPSSSRRATHRFMSDEMLDEVNNPCWQDIYDDDCGMSTIYSASFIAKDWIKSMPCAAGIEDCDMPEDLKLPGAHDDAGIDHVDVMGFLNLKRAKPIGKESEEEEEKSELNP